MNGQYTTEGGTHLTAFKEALTKAVNEYDPKKKFDGDDVREGIISFMTLIGGSTHVVDWYPLQTSIDDEVAYMWLQAADSDTQLCAAQGHSLLKNGQEQTERPIKIDKKNVLGFAYMTDVRPNDLFTMQTRVAIVDSRRFAKSELTKRAIEKLANHD